MRVKPNDDITIKPLQGKVQTVFKHDAKRSNVWLESDGSREYVVKRFESAPAKQLFLRLLQIHPGQCEKRAHRKLQTLGIPVVPIDAMLWQSGKCCLITQHIGSSLDQAIMSGKFDAPVHRHRLARQLGELTAQLLSCGLFFRDMKLSNILSSAKGQLLLIDAGSVRKDRRNLVDGMGRMLRLLEKTAIEAMRQSPSQLTLSRTDRLRFARTMITMLPEDLAGTMRTALELPL